MSDSVSPLLSMRAKTKPWLFTLFFAAMFLVAVAAIPYPVHVPTQDLSLRTLTVRARDLPVRQGPELIAKGKVLGPEDLLYDEAKHVIYTGTEDGWIKRVTVADLASETVVQDWVNTGGRPLGLAFSKDGELVIADANKGLLKVTSEDKIELLADAVDGVEFKFTNGVDVAHDGTIYFTDTSYKYSLEEYSYELEEGRPHGRLISYNPETKQTTLLARDLYFANGIAVSPDQQSVIYCETVLASCSKYYINGSKKGSIEKFIENLPGLPDNIHYIGEGEFLIGLVPSTIELDFKLRYPFIGRAAAIIASYIGRLHDEKDGGVLAVDLQGKPIAHYFDPEFPKIASAIKIANHIYGGSLENPFILRFDVNQFPALSSA